MKKLFVSVLAIAAMVACMNEETVRVQDPAVIGFDADWVENATRADEAVDPSTTTESLTGFDVWGYMDNTSGVIFEGENVTGEKGNFTYNNTAYWNPGHKYYFSALAPVDSKNAKVTPVASGEVPAGLGVVEFTNENGAEDLLYAFAEVDAPAAGQNKVVNFTFKHLLSKVKFSFTNGFTNPNNTIDVKNVKMTVPAEGTIDLNAGYVWENLNGALTLAFGDACAKTAVGVKQEAADERLTIPADAEQEYVISFDVVLYNGDVVAYEGTKTSTVYGVALEMGKAYNFAATLNAENFTEEGEELMPIEFDVVEVEEWDDNTDTSGLKEKVFEVGGEIIETFAAAVAKAMEIDQPVNFFQHVAVDADETITVPAGKNLTLNLNGYTLTSESDQTGSNRNLFDVRGTMTVNGAPLTRAAAEGDGCIAIKHTGENMGWGNSTNVFNVTAGGVLNLENVVAKNLGGSDMAFVAHLNNWGECTLNVDHCTLESTYIAVRVFNSGNDMNNVTIANTELKGKYCFWVHNYKEAGDSVGTDATLNLAIYNPEQNNTFINTGYAPVLFGFNPIYFDAYGNKIIAEGLAISSEGDYTVTSAEGLKTLSEIVNADEDSTEPVDIALGGDIDLSAITTLSTRANVSNWTPIGSEEKPFTGTFDGNGYTIKNLALVESEAKEGKAYIGFFGYAEDATIKNVTFENVYINIPCLDIDHSKGHIGAVAGSLEGTSTIENVTVKGDIQVYATQEANGASRVAVVAGGNSYGNVTMKNVHVIANEGSYLKANNNTGALAGQLQGKSVFEDCSSNIDVTVNKFFAGGLIGLAAGDQLFKNCHTTGDVAVVAGREGRHNDEYRVGGIAGGWADGKTKVCTLENCSYTGTISGKNADGAVAMPLDYLGYVGRGYTLANCGGSKVIIDGVEFVQAYDNVYGVYYTNGAIMEVNGVKAVILQTENGFIAVSVAEKNLKGMDWEDAMNWAAGLGEGWALASMKELNAIYDLRCELNDVLEADNAENALFWEGDELYIKNGSVYYACYMSCDEAPAGELDPQGVAYWENQVFLKFFNDLGYNDYLYSNIDCINKYAPLRDNYFARAVYAL